ncbi:hypothetical protein [Nocardia sp. NPDC050406]|uniref:hypothetical protein n=1 Tax=Nocardia sp. NPDC050406 TaxID=3364318 RepID=UPI003789DE3B
MGDIDVADEQIVSAINTRWAAVLTDTEQDAADTSECQHVFRLTMDRFSDECVYCGLRVAG